MSGVLARLVCHDASQAPASSSSSSRFVFLLGRALLSATCRGFDSLVVCIHLAVILDAALCLSPYIFLRLCFRLASGTWNIPHPDPLSALFCSSRLVFFFFTVHRTLLYMFGEGGLQKRRPLADWPVLCVCCCYTWVVAVVVVVAVAAAAAVAAVAGQSDRLVVFSLLFFQLAVDGLPLLMFCCKLLRSRVWLVVSYGILLDVVRALPAPTRVRRSEKEIRWEMGSIVIGSGWLWMTSAHARARDGRSCT